MNMLKLLVPERYAHLTFSAQACERLAEVRAFVVELGQKYPEQATEVGDALIGRLEYLDSFGGPLSDVDPRRCFQVTLGADWAPLSFTLVWSRLDQTSGVYRFAFNGGLIWHGGGNDPLCVSLTPQLWGVHT